MHEICKKLDSFFNSYSPSVSTKLRENRLDRMKLLLERIGNPEKNYKIIHIAGSKGKGTTASFMSSILRQSGYKTGLYLSPHVYDIRERFTEATKFFSEDLYESTLDELTALIKDFKLPESLGPIEPTTFELYTAYAYLLFYNAKCDFVVQETGMGGRLDATNTVIPIAVCITSIEKEHTKYLGSTLKEIAREKGGIMKKGIPSYVMNQKEEVLSTLKEKSEEIGVSKFKVVTYEDTPSSFDYIDKGGVDKFGYFLGEYESEVNVKDLDFALKVLSDLSLIDSYHSPSFSFNFNFNLPARYQSRTIMKDFDSIFFAVLDGAHTPDSAKILKEHIEEDCGEYAHTLLFSTAEDKDYLSIAKILFPLFERIIVTSTGPWKKSNPEKIFNDTKPLFPNKEILLIPDSKEASLTVINTVPSPSCAVITGSFYLCNEFKETLEGLGLWVE